METLKDYVNPLEYAAEELRRGQYPSAQLRDTARQRRLKLLRYASAVTYGTNEVPMIYAMARLAIDPGQRAVMRDYLDQLDAVDRAEAAGAPAGGSAGANGAALAGFRIED